MRRKDRERDEPFALGVIDAAPFATLALFDAEGQEMKWGVDRDSR